MNTRLLLSSSFALLFVVGCTRPEIRELSSTNKDSLAVATGQVIAISGSDMIDISGVVRPEHSAILSAQLMGTVDAVSVHLGERVHPNELLVKIQSGEVSARYSQAKAQLSQAKFDLSREQGLLLKGASTADLVRNLTTRVHISEGILEEAKAYLSYLQIRAPFEGVIAKKNIDRGTWVSPGVPLIEIEQVGSYSVEANIPEVLAHGLKIGATYKVQISNLNRSLDAKLSEVSSESDMQTHAVFAKFKLVDTEGLLSGRYATIKVPSIENTKLYVASEAVTREGQMERVFVVRDDHSVVLRLVKIGQISGNKTEILAGVDAGENVVLSPTVGLREGQHVEVLP